MHFELHLQRTSDHQQIEGRGKIESNAVAGRTATRQPRHELAAIDTELRTELCTAAAHAMQQCTRLLRRRFLIVQPLRWVSHTP